jgi:cyclophilin family peptidyl-prolyl cis-trans isomerase
MSCRRTFHPEGKTLLRIALALALALASCGDPAREARGEAPAPPGPAIEVPAAASPRDVAVLVVDGFGEIRIELLADLAPLTTAHFVELAERDYYDGTTFHRVIPDFMIQGGDPNTRDRDPRNDGMGGQQDRVEDERPDVSQLRGVVGLANRGVPNSGGSQFYILVADQRHLDGEYAVFGRVTAGMDVVDRIAAVERDLYGRHGPIDRPVHDVVLRDVRIERAAR